MSYSVYLTIDTGNPNGQEMICDFNHTSNCSTMFQEALGVSIRMLDGCLAEDLLGILKKAVEDISDPRRHDHYAVMNPKNGWGSVESAKAFLTEIYHACLMHPKCTVEVSC